MKVLTKIARRPGRVVGRMALVAFAMALLATQSGAQRDSPASQQRETTVHYDVVVTINSSYHSEARKGNTGFEVTDASSRLSARWSNVGFRLISFGGKVTMVLSTSTTFPGTMERVKTFAHHDPPDIYKPVNCEGSLVHANAASLIITFSLGQGIFGFLGGPADLLKDDEEFSKAFDAGRKSSCGEGWSKAPETAAFDFTLPNGIKFDAGGGTIEMDVRGGGTVSFPLDKILAGMPFVIDSGRQTSRQGKQIDMVRVEFTPRCPTCAAPPLDDVPTAQPPSPPTPRAPCNPNLMADADRKWKTAQELFKAAANHQKEAIDEFSKWKTEEAKTMAELALEKNDLLKIVELALEEGGKHLLHNSAGVFGLFSTAAWIYTDVRPHVRDHDQAMRDAAKMTDTATDLATKSIQDMKDAFAQDKVCEDLRQKAIAREQLLDQAKALREKWAQDGSALYKEDPNDSNSYPMDANAALNRAIQILNEKSKTSTSPTSSFSLASLRSSGLVPPGLLTSQNKNTDPGIVVTVEQARRALAQIDAAIAMMNSGRDLMAKRKAFAAKRAADLNTLNVRLQR